MKMFALFLPQFHEIPENNEWWGQGFTEWFNVRKAKPLFKGHVQPLHPLNGNYYNLLDKETVEWQTRLLHDYNVDGMIYYHYYFKGKMLLEKPAENLLKWKDIDQPFFFCWANHDWNRAWEGSRTLLQKQEYGTEADWEAHFQYLLPFFKDERYEKKDNKPLFMIFNSNFPERKEMIAYLGKRCRDEGFAGLYVIETYNLGYDKESIEKMYADKTDETERIYLREPSCIRGIFWLTPGNLLNRIKWIIIHRLGLTRLRVTSSSAMYKHVRKEELSPKYVHGIDFGFDNTPRHGIRGDIVTPPDRKTFESVMDYYKNEDYIFINAWNEWAEGMTLEPTEENGYKFLEWIRDWRKTNAV